MKYLLKKNAVIMFSLVDNVEYINFNISDGKNDYLMQYTRDWANDNMDRDVREFSQGEEEFTQLLKTAEESFTAEAIVNLVKGFGSKLQTVSLLAPKDIVAESVQENYSPFVSPTLIEEWISDPAKAPGRLTSSP